MSGTVLPEWSASNRTIEASAKLVDFLLGESLDLDSLTLENTQALKERLKSVTLDELKTALKATVVLWNCL
jgi:hypothetical protein